MNVSPPVQRQDEKRREKDRPKVGNNNGQLRIANATSSGAHKAAWAKMETSGTRRGFIIKFLKIVLLFKYSVEVQ